jgi:hypothetical protein
MASIGQSITGPRFVETDEVLLQVTLMLSWLRLSQWFDRQKAHLEVLESQLRGLVKAIEVVSKHRCGLSFTDLIHKGYINPVDTELASATGEFAQTVSDLAASDLGKSVSHSLEALAELERKAQETESAQTRADQTTLLSTADEYARLVSSVRVRFCSIRVPQYADLSAHRHHRWRLVLACECIMRGRTLMQSSVASSRRTNATARKARPRPKKQTVSDIHTPKSARCV